MAVLCPMKYLLRLSLNSQLVRPLVFSRQFVLACDKISSISKYDLLLVINFCILDVFTGPSFLLFDFVEIIFQRASNSRS